MDQGQARLKLGKKGAQPIPKNWAQIQLNVGWEHPKVCSAPVQSPGKGTNHWSEDQAFQNSY